MGRSRKPRSIEPGKCYRLFAFYGLGQPSDTIAYVYAIEGKKQRWVRVRGVNCELGYNADSYTNFLRNVHSEVPNVIN